ncbi:urea ABC transporter permease subunit UrtB [Rhodovibrio sodomensis]|uniref:Urea ABC transporter permease subunit UrtB n=1 Tax=Rhodovibrio sodomensis TaxID=1088 RepID=A0ABS1DB47_9PROT|nr:urea ABC transporter permease subunit UrtB [Rhodovibrio sodomensis]MBK1667166.1 urea ABC transporter permease subunit UrtB [Rhodovibrio sodomensis]
MTRLHRWPRPGRAARAALLLALGLLVSALQAPPAAAQQADAAAFAEAVQTLATGDREARERAVDRIVEIGHPRAAAVLSALMYRRLATVAGSDRVVLEPEGGGPLEDALTGEPVENPEALETETIYASNQVRRKLRTAVSQVQIFAEDPQARLASTRNIVRAPSDATADLLRRALDREEVPRVEQAIRLALAKVELLAGDAQTKLAAIERLSGSTSPEVRSLLLRLLDRDDVPAEVRTAAREAAASIETRLTLIDWGQRVFQGISLGSVLLLAAVGLAITFGVMGVINLAHGEMLMLGAYTTFVVQQVVLAVAPGLSELSVLFALPAAFLVAGAMGVLLEQTVVRHLYGRPLETLLATFGISLLLQQGVRTIFGAPNKEVSNPFWMSGSIELIGGAVLTYNRLFILVFALAVLAVLALVIKRTTFGLQMRAVTQNRGMARAMGIPSGRIDALTFGLGSGIAGVGGVALSQITNVSPNLGQSFIVDSFMVVVFGGVGSLWGVLGGSMVLGILNKFLEPYAGAMLGKVIVLVLIILFIQWRPRGLFALKGRAGEQ